MTVETTKPKLNGATALNDNQLIIRNSNKYPEIEKARRLT